MKDSLIEVGLYLVFMAFMFMLLVLALVFVRGAWQVAMWWVE